MPKVLLDLLSSKKFLALMSSEIGVLIGALQGVVTWRDALLAMAGLVIGYMGSQGYADGQSGGMTSSQPGTPSAADLPKN